MRAVLRAVRGNEGQPLICGCVALCPEWCHGAAANSALSAAQNSPGCSGAVGVGMCGVCQWGRRRELPACSVGTKGLHVGVPSARGCRWGWYWLPTQHLPIPKAGLCPVLGPVVGRSNERMVMTPVTHVTGEEIDLCIEDCAESLLLCVSAGSSSGGCGTPLSVAPLHPLGTPPSLAALQGSCHGRQRTLWLCFCVFLPGTSTRSTAVVRCRNVLMHRSQELPGDASEHVRSRAVSTVAAAKRKSLQTFQRDVKSV